MSVLYVLALLVAAGLLLSPFVLLARRLLPELPGATLLLVFVATASLYFLEHVLMLPTVGLWLLWAGLLGWGLWFNQDLLSMPLAGRSTALGLSPVNLLALGLCIVWPLVWRFTFPSLYASSEKLTNLLFLQNFLYAEQLPAMDRWLPPYRFDFYYPLQYYLMSLPGRMLGLPPGILYQAGFVTLVSATLFTCWKLGLATLGSPRRAAVLALSLGLCGTGAALISVPWHYKTMQGEGQNPAFVSLTAEARFNGAVFHKIFGEDAGPKSQVLPQEQPLEYFAYQIFLGDYHPTLSGFFLALALLALLFHLSRDREPRQDWLPLGLLGALPMLMLASNSWMFPHVVLAAGLWLPWRWWVEKDNTHFQTRFWCMAAGALCSVLIFLPHLQGLAGRSFSIGMELVPLRLRGSPWPYLMQWWPLLLVCGLSLWQTRLRQPSGYVALVSLILLGFNGLVYVNDLSVDIYERTNSALKWWSWTWTFGLIGGLVGLLGGAAEWARKLAMGLLLLLLLPMLPLLNQLLLHSGDDVGKIHGDHIYLRDHTHKSIVLYLRAQEPGLALENVKASAYDDSGALALMGHKPVFLGWPDHQYTWRGGFGEVGQRKEAINALYEAKLPQAGRWAAARNIQYIVWSGRECRESGGKQGQEKVDALLQPEYSFHRTESWGDCPVGVWRPQPR
ncbi:MAG: DUF2298 domain-containing protein [Oceanococcaceae bacterium]